LPSSFQVQEFLPGSPVGITAHFAVDRRFAVLDVHRQEIDTARRFAGGRWSRVLQDKVLEHATALCSQVAAIEEPRITGLICFDVIDGKVIEVNPRVTASAPIPHLLARNGMIARHVGGGFRIERIDLRTRVRVPYELIESGDFARLVERTMDERRVLVLPQGLNPFGDSRLAFVNDDEKASSQRHFLERLELMSATGRERVPELS
jgi:predicted ATP-grasp superfamily ATP-dependent carboligase